MRDPSVRLSSRGRSKSNSGMVAICGNDFAAEAFAALLPAGLDVSSSLGLVDEKEKGLDVFEALADFEDADDDAFERGDDLRF